MSLFTATFRPSAGVHPAGVGDAEGKTDTSDIPNDPVAPQTGVGRTIKNLSKSFSVSRYDLNSPSSGSVYINDGLATITKAKLTFEVWATATGNGFFRLGVLRPHELSFWLDPTVAFNDITYPLMSDLPAISDLNDVLIPFNLQGGDVVATTAPMAFTPASFAAGEFKSLGQGYSTDFTTTNLTSTIQGAIEDDSNGLNVVGLELDSDQTPLNNLEFFRLWSSSQEPTHSGMILEMEWARPGVVTAKSEALNRVQAPGSHARARVLAESGARVRVQADMSVARSRVLAKGEAGERVRAPLSHAKSGS